MGECRDIEYKQIHLYFHNLEKQIHEELLSRRIVDENMVSLLSLSELSFMIIKDFRKDFIQINFHKNRLELYVDDNHKISIKYHISDIVCMEPLCSRMFYEHGEQLSEPSGKCIVHRPT